MQPPPGGQGLPGSQPMGFPPQQGLPRAMYHPQPGLGMQQQQQQQFVQGMHHMQQGAMAAAHHMQAAGGAGAMAQHHAAHQQHLLQQQHQHQQAATSAALAASQQQGVLMNILEPDPPTPSPSQALTPPVAGAAQLAGGAAGAAAGGAGSGQPPPKPKPKLAKRRKGEADITSTSYAEWKEQQEKKRRVDETEGGRKAGDDGADAAAEEATALRLPGARRPRARGPARDANELLPQAELERLMAELGIAMDFRLHPEILPLVGTHVDSIINAVLDFGAGLARRRKGMAAVLRPQDLAAYMSRTYGLTVPGLHSQVVPYRRPAASELHKARAAAVRQAEVPKVGRGGAGRAGAAVAAEGRGRALQDGLAGDASRGGTDHG